MNDKLQNAKKILSYWQTTSFLKQDSFQLGSKKTNEKVLMCTVKKAENNGIVLLDNVFLKISQVLREYEEELYKSNKTKKEKDRIEINPLTGRITFEFGWVRRQCCIDRINEFYKYENDTEDNDQKIAYFGFQLSNDGKYWKNSLSISPILWSIDALKYKKDISQDNYNADKKDFEKTYLEEEIIFKGNDNLQLSEMRDIGFNAKDAITPNYIKILENKIYNKFVANVIRTEKDYDQLCKISFTMYANKDEYDKAYEQDYSLSMDFYSKDIEMVKDSLGDDDVICNYICSGIYENNKRLDVLNDSEKMKEKIAELTDLRNAPLGKWPSQYNLVFMQQLAVNIESSQVLSKQPIFSVNGPPGTGKTTLLKEIIADNIIRRAKVLSDYDEPDNLFSSNDFLCGTKTSNHAYSRYQPHWYSLNNENVNKYGILIASSNNTAVENITKELPKLKDIVNISDSKSVWISQEKYKEISALFNPKVNLDDKDGIRDIYFNKTAETYITNEIKEDCWGIIAAPLGKKENIKSYYLNFLSRVLRNMRGKNDGVTDNYFSSRKKFLEQYDKVLSIQEDVNKPSILETKLSTEDIDKTIQENQDLIDCFADKNELLDEEIQAFNIQKLEKKVEILRVSNAELQKEINAQESNIDYLKSRNEDLKSSLFEVQKSMTWVTKIFKSKKYKEAEKQECSIKNKISSKNKEIESAKKQLNEKKSKQEEYSVNIKALEKSFEEFNAKNTEYNSNLQKIKELNKKIAGLLKEKKSREQAINQLEQEKTKIIDCLYSQAEQITSKENDKKEKAHINNLWLTDEYDIERMKLFYYALEFNKQFVLSSYCLNKNLVVLASYWGFGDENIKYHPTDMQRFVKSLYQSLFLVTPVISTTFASIGRMFENVQDRKAFGTLIVDEAGQAEPKMAVGALYRCNKAMIVGDPKQIEPVIDDDTNKLCKGILKNSNANTVLSSCESVQSYADRMNMYGTFLKSSNQEDDEWVGLPLTVHRRCNSPMFEISNTISYGGIMVKKTVQKPFKKGIYNSSKWIEIAGNEYGKKNHFVAEQGEEVLKMLRIAKSNGGLNNVFVITPFKTVETELKKKIRNDVGFKDVSYQFWNEHIGTVHTFQGKEADEVIFVLGCDEKAIGAVKWVNSNIVNVAASRAKHRFYIIGAINVWKTNRYIVQAKNCLDLETFKSIVKVQNDKNLSDSEKSNQLRILLMELPSKEHEINNKFYVDSDAIEEQDDFYEKNVSLVIQDNIISDVVLNAFGFSTIEEINEFSDKTKSFLKNGLLIYGLLLSVFKQIGKEQTVEIDTSCCAIEFAKALESQAKETFIKSIKKTFPDWQMKKGKTPLYAKDAEDKEFTLGAIRTILNSNMNKKDKSNNFFGKSQEYKTQFVKCLRECTNIRNNTAHSEIFSAESLKCLRKFGFLPMADGEYNELTKGLMGEMLQLQEMYQKH